MRWIRWQGFVTFIAVLGLIAGFGWLFAEGLTKKLIENYGSDLAGAKVSVDRVELTLDPLAFNILNLEVTDSDNPMKNIVQLSSINAEVNGLRLLMGQVLVEQAELLEMEFNTDRATSGALTEKRRQGEDSSLDSAPSIADEAKEVLSDIKADLPSAEEILSRETLLTKTRQVELEIAYKEEKEKLKKLKLLIPTKSKIKSYEKRIRSATKGKINSIADFERRKAELKKVQAELKSDKKAIKSAQKQIKLSSVLLKEKIKALKAAPKADLERLKKKYDISGGGASNFAALMFGEQVGEWSRLALYWYEKVKPYIQSSDEDEVEGKDPERLAGRFVHFDIAEPIPDFLVRKAKVSAVLPVGRVEALLVDVTHQQEIINRPTRMTVKGNALDGIDKLDVTATFNHIAKSNPKDQLAYRMEGVALTKFELIGGSKMPITLDKAVAIVDGGVLYESDVFTATMNGAFNEAVFAGGASEGLGKALGTALKTINSFNLQGEAKGNLKDLNVSINSDLDKKIKSALKGQFAAKKDALEIKLKKKLNAEVTQFLSKYTDDLDGLSDSKDVDSAEKDIEELLEAKVDDYKAQLKRERKEKEEKLRKKAEKEKQEARKKLDEERRILDEKMAKEQRRLEEKLKDEFNL